MRALNEYVVDTHALFWYLSKSSKLSRTALNVFRDGEEGNAKLVVPTIVLCELYYLNGKLGLPLAFSATCNALVSASQFEIVDLGLADVLDLDAIAGVPEMHDRLIAAAAARRHCPVITKDEAIVSSGAVPTIW